MNCVHKLACTADRILNFCRWRALNCVRKHSGCLSGWNRVLSESFWPVPPIDVFEQMKVFFFFFGQNCVDIRMNVCRQSYAQVVWTVNTVVMHSVFMLTGTIINCERYCGTLGKAERSAAGILSLAWSIVLQQDNARSHTNTKTTAGIRRFGVTLLDHPTYRLDLVSSGFRLICKPKDRLRGCH